MKRTVTFDLETTGLDKTKDHIIQFAAIKCEGTKLIDSLDLKIQPTGPYSIGIGAYLKHNISVKDLESCPHLDEVAQQIIDFFETPETVEVLSYNGISFDIPFLVGALKRIGIEFSFVGYDCYDAFLEEKRRNGNTLEQTYLRYKGKTMEESGLTAHNALSDVKATYSIFFAQQQKQQYGPETMFGNDNAIMMNVFNGELMPCFNIGKYKGISVEFIKSYDAGYLKWAISDKSNFDDITKKFISKILE
jgi:DNA polymerase-3 subunit epsilon